ncbi:NADP-dependent isocitrate dehydrogenase [Pestalotiopsis sp. IQ-011]
MSTSSLPYYQRPYFGSADDLRRRDPGYDLGKHCFYMLNVCELCGRPLGGQELPPPGGGRARFSIMTDTTEYARHEARKCDKHQCKRFIVGTYAQYGMRCCYCAG